MNNDQDTGSQPGPAADARAEEASASPTPRKRTRKPTASQDVTAESGAAGADEAAAAPKRRPRKAAPAVDVEAAAQDAKSEVPTQEAIAPEAAPSAEATEVADQRPKRSRTLRAKTTEVQVPLGSSDAENTTAQPQMAPDTTVDGVVQAEPQAEIVRVPVAGGALSLAPVTDEGDDADDREEAQLAAQSAAADALAAATPLVMPVAEAAARFEDVLSGQYDAEADVTPVDEAQEADPGKRVLRPEPEAPKLHKVLAQSGVGSRRDMEALIEAGQVTVNGEVAHLGMRVTYGDQIRVAGKPVRVRIAPGPARVLAYHKPVGEVVTHNDPEGRPTVFRSLPRLTTGRWLSVGRLDLNTEGLLLFTNSGDLANQLMHPRFGVEREYAVRVLGTLDEQSRDLLLEGVTVDGQVASFLSIEEGGGEGINHWYRVVIAEGRNREVRKLFDVVGLTVSRLIRIRYGTVVLPRGLKRGVWVEMDENDVRSIRRLAGGDAQERPDRGPRPPRGKGRHERGSEGDRSQRVDRPPRGEGPGRPQGAPMAPARGEEAQAFDGAGAGDFEPGQQRPPQGRNDGPRGPHGRNNKNGGRPNQPVQQGGPRPNGPGGQGPRGPARGGRPMNGPGGPGNGAGNGNGNGPGYGGGNAPANRGNPRERDFEDPMRIPNPLEQTFDKRFATGSKRITTGFGRPTEEPDPNADRGGKKGGPKQPDPMQTSVGYIGAEAYFRSPSAGKGRGRRR